MVAHVKTDTPENPTLKGAEYRRTHKSTVVGILGDRTPTVSSKGSRFYNVDRWTLRKFVEEMCRWAHGNPECIPTRTDIEAWVYKANTAYIPKREIVIANTPEHLSQRTAMALVGGAVHEAWHTLYSCLRGLRNAEMCALVLPRWTKVPDWSKFYKLLQDWNNIVEDIRIERVGNLEFPGARTKMHDLQDFILELEEKGAEEVRAHSGSGKPVRGSLSIITGVFRDIGLGYNTMTQRAAMARYRRDDPKAVTFVTDGPLSALLRESIALDVKDDLGCVRVAMDVIAVLYAESRTQDPADDDENDEHQPGEDHKLCCPKCKAPGNKLVVRPKSDGCGGKVPGFGILTCSVCGYQEVVPLKAPSEKKGKPEKKDPENTPRFEGFDPPEAQSFPEDENDGPERDSEAGDTGKDDSDETGQTDGNTESEQDSGQEDSSGDPAEDPSDEDGSDEGEEESDGTSDKKSDDSDEGEKESDEDSEDSRNDSEGSTGNDGDPEPSGTDSGGDGAGGHAEQDPQIEGNDWSDLADEALSQAEDATGLLDNNAALEEAVNDATDKENATDEPEIGEARWNPFDPSLDEVIVVSPSSQGRKHDATAADNLYKSVKQEAAYLRARLRQIVRAMEMRDVIHGLPRGRRLSARFLVDSKTALIGGIRPRRAYMQRDEKLDVSLAAAIVIDESGSMCKGLKDATRMMTAITEPLDALGCAVQVSGIRDGVWVNSPNPAPEGYHRFEGVVHDIFKNFDDPYRSVRWRFANTRAEGGTPLSDGVQFGLKSLESRPEGHRVLFVLTDGHPNGGHLPVIRHQLRMAADAGIHVIGVGIGHDAAYVETVFPDSVYSGMVSEIPKLLVGKLNELFDSRSVKRGCRLRQTS